MKVHSDTQCLVIDGQVARLEGELAAAQAAIEKDGVVVFTGLSVPKRRLDEAIAEHTQEVAGLWTRVRAVEAENLEMAAALRDMIETYSDGRSKMMVRVNQILDDIDAAERRARAALSGEGKVWEQVEKALEYHIKICPLSPDLEAVLAVMKGE